MGGLQRILKICGSMIVQGEDGKKVTWVWDYKNDKARLKSEMTKDELAESEKVKYIKYIKKDNESISSDDNCQK